MDFLQDNRMTNILVNFGVGFVAAFVLFMILKPTEETDEWKLALGVGVVALVTPMISKLLINKF